MTAHQHNNNINKKDSNNSDNVIQPPHGDVRTTSPNNVINPTVNATPSTPISIASSSAISSRYIRPTASPLQGQKPLKSALKKVTMSDLLKRSASELQINTNLSSTISISEANQQLGAFSPAVIASHRQPKLRFNQYVEQCVALSSSDDDNSKKKNSSRVRMAELNDVHTHHGSNEEQEAEEEVETSSDNDYEPGDESDAGSIIIMRRHKVKSSIKKIEPALLKTNSRSDQDTLSDDSSDDEIIPNLASSSGGYHRRKHHHGKKSTNNVDWNVESAESDAFVKHIINVSKGKQPVANRDPAADRIPVQQHQWDDGHITDGGDIMQAKSDYDYEFDDDDWDTQSEHAEDDVHFSTTSDEYLPPVAPAPPVGCQIANKVPVNNQPILPPRKPTNEKSTSRTSATNDIQYNQQHYDNNSGGNLSNSSSSNSLISSIAHWASSHLWPAEN
jgi:hypothetical protein